MCPAFRGKEAASSDGFPRYLCLTDVLGAAAVSPVKVNGRAPQHPLTD